MSNNKGMYQIDEMSSTFKLHIYSLFCFYKT